MKPTVALDRTRIDRKNSASESQFGFADYAAPTHRIRAYMLFTTCRVIQEKLHEQFQLPRPMRVFVDLTTAFDAVNHE